MIGAWVALAALGVLAAVCGAGRRRVLQEERRDAVSRAARVMLPLWVGRFDRA